MWTRTAIFAAACLWTGCTSASSAAPSDDDESDLTLQLGSSVVDPGPRGGAKGAGFVYDTLSDPEKAFFEAAREVFAEVDSVSGKIEGEDGKGLGPTFNGNSCAQCHAEPDVGGTSPHPTLGFVRTANPQTTLGKLDRVAGQEQRVPSFVKADGPVREARFV